ncbi:GDP-L-fucose synthase family protein [Salibacter halophilus]|nr:GDP-L-fucose synthase [Salibacter halophilus]
MKNMKIYIAGHRGMVGSAIWRNLEKSDNNNLIGRTSKELDLKDQKAVNDFIESEKPDVIIDAAARVGGILANNEYPYQFLMENMLIQNNLINASVNNKIKKFIFLGSSCIYPKMAPQPLREEHLLTGPLEPTNEWYAIAKISGVKATESVRKQYGYDYVSLMPTNLYGPYDNFDLKTSHVLPAMIRKFHEAKLNGNKNVSLWGTGSPKREFLHVDDLAKAVRFALENELPENLYNVGYGSDLSIKELAELIQKITDHKGRIDWDPSKPDGTPRKWMDSSKLRNNGWKPSIELEDGIRATYSWFLDNVDQIKEVKINN